MNIEEMKEKLVTKSKLLLSEGEKFVKEMNELIKKMYTNITHLSASEKFIIVLLIVCLLFINFDKEGEVE